MVLRSEEIDPFSASSEILMKTSFSRTGVWSPISTQCTKSSELGSSPCVKAACDAADCPPMEETEGFVCATKNGKTETFASECHANSCGYKPLHHGRCGTVTSAGKTCSLPSDEGLPRPPARRARRALTKVKAVENAFASAFTRTEML